MQLEVAHTYCWVILFSSIVMTVASVAALVSDCYRETLPENIGLSMMALAGLVVTLQIGSNGYATGGALAFLSSSAAVLALANLAKQWSAHDPEPCDRRG